jgi:beta-glucosidase
MKFYFKSILLLLAGVVLGGCVAATNQTRHTDQQEVLTDWPRIPSAIVKDVETEARIGKMVAEMSLEQKIGQMTQPEIKSITPAEVTKYYIGSVLNGGGSWPAGNKHAAVAAWVELSDQYYEASMAVDSPVKVPIIWGTDAVHGHNNIFGATIFPHNIGLGAAHDAALVKEIGFATGRAVRATGITWVFAPTLAVVRNDRWGRTYEGFSEDGKLVHEYAGAYVAGLQGTFRSDANVVATAKHFIGDGGTDQGKDQGINQSSMADMLNIHAQGYYSALSAGVQTVMASFNSWNDTGGGIDYGKMHGSKALLTEALKEKMGFDGFIVSDWNAIAQLPGCTNSSCPQAINAGIDMVMVPDDWKAFISNTVQQVKKGEIPVSRIDDAVTRILRVKLRSGLFDKKPSQSAHAGKLEAVQAREVARRAVRESLVLLKNNDGVLPLSRARKILVVGKGADSMSNQTGGWSLTWQGTDNANSDFPAGDTILAGIREAVGDAQVVYSEKAKDIDPGQFDAVIAVLGETPYAETNGDITAPNSLQHTNRHPEDLAVLRAVSGKGRPVVTVFLSGRPLYVNDLLNLSDAFIAAWLPGTEGRGVADVMFKNAAGKVNHDFRGTLSFSWPKSACQDSLNWGDQGYAPLFPLGYGLTYASLDRLGVLDESASPAVCGKVTTMPLFVGSAKAPYGLYASAAATGWKEQAIGADLNATFNVPEDKPVLKIRTVDINMQQDAKLVSWDDGMAQIYLRSQQVVDMRPYALTDGALEFDVVVASQPQGDIRLSMDCGNSCRGTVSLAGTFRKLPTKTRHVVKVPLSCFAQQGADLAKVEVPFSFLAEKSFAAAFANIQIRADAAKDQDALRCADIALGSQQSQM